MFVFYTEYGSITIFQRQSHVPQNWAKLSLVSFFLYPFLFYSCRKAGSHSHSGIFICFHSNSWLFSLAFVSSGLCQLNISLYSPRVAVKGCSSSKLNRKYTDKKKKSVDLLIKNNSFHLTIQFITDSTFLAF